MHVLKNQMSFDFGEETLYIRPYESIQKGYQEYLKENSCSKEILDSLKGIEFSESNSREMKELISARYYQTDSESAKKALSTVYVYAFGMMEGVEMLNEDKARRENNNVNK